VRGLRPCEAFAIADAEGTEADQPHVTPLLQCVGDRIEHPIDGFRCVAFREAGADPATSETRSFLFT